MPLVADRAQVIEMVDAGAPLVDVLPPKEHEQLRIAGSHGIWLRRLTEEAVSRFSSNDPIIVYCHDPL